MTDATTHGMVWRSDGGFFAIFFPAERNPQKRCRKAADFLERSKRMIYKAGEGLCTISMAEARVILEHFDGDGLPLDERETVALMRNRLRETMGKRGILMENRRRNERQEWWRVESAPDMLRGEWVEA